MKTDTEVRDEFVRRLADFRSSRSPSTAVRHRLAVARQAAEKQLTWSDYVAAVDAVDRAHAIAVGWRRDTVGPGVA
jgi:hypothetical protein